MTNTHQQRSAPFQVTSGARLALAAALWLGAGCASERPGWERRGESPPRPTGATRSVGSESLQPYPSSDGWRAPAVQTSTARSSTGQPSLGALPAAAAATSLSAAPSGGMRVPGFHVTDEESLRSIVDDLRTLTGLPLVLDFRAEEAVLDAGVVFDIHFDNPVRVRSLLDILVELSDDTIAWTVRHGAILITTPERARGGYALRMYDVRDLVAGVPSYPGPAVGSLLFDGDEEDREIVRTPLLEEDSLIDLITSTIAADTWDDEGVSIELQNGMLVVRHHEAVHDALAAWAGR